MGSPIIGHKNINNNDNNTPHTSNCLKREINKSYGNLQERKNKAKSHCLK